MDQSLVFDLNQAAINGIRAAGATKQLILIEGNSYTGAWTWVSSGNADSLIDLVDPNDNIAYGTLFPIPSSGRSVHTPTSRRDAPVP